MELSKFPDNRPLQVLDSCKTRNLLETCKALPSIQTHASIRYPQQIILLRGNHECSAMAKEYGFFDEIDRRYNKLLYAKARGPQPKNTVGGAHELDRNTLRRRSTKTTKGATPTRAIGIASLSISSGFSPPRERCREQGNQNKFRECNREEL